MGDGYLKVIRRSSSLFRERSFCLHKGVGGAHHPGHALRKDPVLWQHEGTVPTEPDSGTMEGAFIPPAQTDLESAWNQKHTACMGT